MGFDLGYRSKYSSVSKNFSSSRGLILIFCSLVLFQIYLWFCVYFLACSKVSGKYFFSNRKTTDRPFTREYKRQSSVANPSIFFTESTIQPYQSTDGSHGKLAKSFAVYRFSINRFMLRQKWQNIRETTIFDQFCFRGGLKPKNLPCSMDCSMKNPAHSCPFPSSRVRRGGGRNRRTCHKNHSSSTRS